MDIQDLIFNGLAESMSTDSKTQLVLQLAEKLGVEDAICTAETAIAIAARARHEGAAEVIENGQTVRTEQGEARAILLDQNAQRALAPLLEALNG